MEEKHRSETTGPRWIQIIITALITGVITLGGSLLLNYFQTNDPRLVYNADDTLPFESPQENIAIYRVKIENSGRKVIEDVVCLLSFPTGAIQQTRVIIEPSINKSENVSSNQYRLEIANLNPGEDAVISVLVSGSDTLPAQPIISLRGKGVTAVRALDVQGKGFDWLSMASAITAAIGLFAVLSSINVFKGSKLLGKVMGVDSDEDVDDSKHSDDQKQVLAYLCGIHNLNEEVERYLNMSCDVTYWSESDRFASLAIESPKGQESENRKLVLKDLLEYAYVRSKSQGILHYNIARIAKAQDNKEEADSHLNKAKSLIPKLVETRTKLDPIWQRDNLGKVG